MRLFKAKKAKETAVLKRVVRPKTSVHNYYTVSNRKEGIPTIDLSKRTRSGTDIARSLPKLRATMLYKLVLVGALAALGYMMLSLQASPLITVYDKQRQPKKADRYEAFASDLLKSSILNRSKITLNATSIETSLKNEFPEISSVYVGSDLLGKRPLINIIQATIPFELNSKGNSYLLSDEGKVVGLSDEQPTIRTDILVSDVSGVDINKGEVFLRSDDATFIINAKQILKSKGRVMTSVILSEKPREALLVLSDKNYKIKVFFDDSVTDQLGSFFAAEEVVGERGEVPSEYIDVRAGEKVFWL